MKKSLIVFLIQLFILAAPVIGKSEKKSLFINAKILTMDKNMTKAGGFIICGEKIVEVGSTEKILKSKKIGDDVIDLSGRTVIPGLHDAHLHFESGAKLIMNRIDLRFMNKKQILAKIAAAVRSSPSGAIIKAYSYNHAYFKNKKWPDRYDLDKVAPKNPVIITRVDGHSIWVNSVALKKAGIDKNTKDPQGGEILRFRDGKPTGILKENAETLISGIRGPKMILSKTIGKNTLLEAIRYANRLGLTSVTTSGGLKLFRKLLKLEKTGKLSLRFNVWITPDEIKKCIKEGLKFNSGSDKVKLSFVKIFADGSLGSVSAAFFKPYKNRPSKKGILIHPIPELNKLIADAHRHNWQTGVHAIGNRGVSLVLDAVDIARKKYGIKNLRHRIEHTQFIRDEDIPRFKKLGMIPSMQPTHCTTDLLVVEERIGTKRASQGYRWNSFNKAGIQIAFGTDWPVEPLDPRRGLYSSVERKNIENKKPESGWFQNEAISIEKAVRYYTIGAAFASFNEKKLGSIEAGKTADITIFDGDLSAVSKNNKREILSLPVYMTIMNGNVVYDAGKGNH